MKVSASPSLVRALEEIGISWEALVQSAQQIILFGSSAANLADSHSDWDLLCIGDGESRRTGKVDIIWISADEVMRRNWLGSELAAHVAAYGVWLAGEDTWRAEARVSKVAVERKRMIVSVQVSAVQRNWPDLTGPFRSKHLTKIRRDLQRLVALEARNPVPPTPVLDLEWKAMGADGSALRNLAAKAGFTSHLANGELSAFADDSRRILFLG